MECVQVIQMGMLNQESDTNVQICASANAMFHPSKVPKRVINEMLVVSLALRQHLYMGNVWTFETESPRHLSVSALGRRMYKGDI